MSGFICEYSFCTTSFAKNWMSEELVKWIVECFAGFSNNFPAYIKDMGIFNKNLSYANIMPVALSPMHYIDYSGFSEVVTS